MHTLLDTCLKEIEIHEYLGRVLAGLSDDDDVKKLCYLMLVKLAQIAPTAVTQRESRASTLNSISHADFSLCRSRRHRPRFHRFATAHAQGWCREAGD